MKKTIFIIAMLAFGLASFSQITWKGIESDYFHFDNTSADVHEFDRAEGYSVRCIKD